MQPKPQISPNVRNAAREHMVGWPLGRISDVFQSHGFVPVVGSSPQTTGARRTLVEEFYAGIDWQKQSDCGQVLCVFEAVLDDAENENAVDEQTRSDGFAASSWW